MNCYRIVAYWGEQVGELEEKILPVAKTLPSAFDVFYPPNLVYLRLMMR